MTTRRRLLVGVDGSDDSLKAVKYAVREALADGSDLWLVYATDPVVIVNGAALIRRLRKAAPSAPSMKPSFSRPGDAPVSKR